MKLIQCILRPEKLHDVVSKLVTITTGLTVYESWNREPAMTTGELGSTSVMSSKQISC